MLMHLNSRQSLRSSDQIEMPSTGGHGVAIASWESGQGARGSSTKQTLLTKHNCTSLL